MRIYCRLRQRFQNRNVKLIETMQKVEKMASTFSVIAFILSS